MKVFVFLLGGGFPFKKVLQVSGSFTAHVYKGHLHNHVSLCALSCLLLQEHFGGDGGGAGWPGQSGTVAVTQVFSGDMEGMLFKMFVFMLKCSQNIPDLTFSNNLSPQPFFLYLGISYVFLVNKSNKIL